MTNFSSFQPFLIGQGQSQTGLFQYYESWIAPEDAFDDIQDAYVNRGQIWKRNGQTLFGRMKYCSSEVLAYADGGVNYNGTITTHLPITAGTVTIRTKRAAAQPETYTDNGAGVLTGSAGSTGTIVYTTGVWTIASAGALTTDLPIMIDYGFEPTTATNPHINVSIVGIGTGAITQAGTYDKNLPMQPNTVSIIALQSNGTETYTDDGAGVLTGDIAGAGTIDYDTGAWFINPAGAATILVDSAIQLRFKPAYTDVTLYSIGTGDGLAGAHTGTFTASLPLSPGEVFIVAIQSNGTETYNDILGTGVLTGNLAGTGTINYTTGAWSFTPTGANTVTLASNIQLGKSGKNAFAIMGINQWNDETNNTFKVTVEDTRRMSVFNQTSGTFDPVCDVAETLAILPDSTTPQTFRNFSSTAGSYVAPFASIAPLSMTFTLVNPVTGAVVDTTFDDGAGRIQSTGFFRAAPNNGTVNYNTGDITVRLDNAGLTSGWAVNVTFTLQNDYFFGDTSNFFNWTNWYYPTNLIPTATQIVDGTTVIRPTQFHDGFLYLTNNNDPITLFNGTTISRPAFAIQQAQLGLGKNEITKCLDIKTYASRLIFIRPSTVQNNNLPDPQSIRWSAQFQPTNTVADIPGSGGELSAATSDWIQSAKFLKDFLIISMQNSTWTFRFTGNSFNPFQFYKVESTKTCNAPYASLEFDEYITSMGTKGFVACDGVSVTRYDEKVFDLYEDVNDEVFKQCFGLRFDALNQSWMLYPDGETDAQVSNKVFLHNYAEDSWSIFNMPLSCLGLGFGMRDLTWADLAIAWQDEDARWNSYLQQQESLRLLGGDHNGLILQLNDGETDNGTNFGMQFTSKKYNPFAKDGMKAQFGYLDVYYTVSPDVTLEFQFFIDNSTTVAFTRSIQLVANDGIEDPNYSYAWQRLFINVQAQTLQFKCADKIDAIPTSVGGFRILGMILWASPSGRLIQ